MAAGDSMSDVELRQRLKMAGIDAGPITNDTRELYVRALRRNNQPGILKPAAQRDKKVRNLEIRLTPTRPPKRKPSLDREEPTTKRFKYGGLVGKTNFNTSGSNNSVGITLGTDSDSSNVGDDDCFIAEASPSPPRGLISPMESEPSVLTKVAGSLQLIGSGVKKFMKRNLSVDGPIMKAAALLNPSSSSPRSSPNMKQPQRRISAPPKSPHLHRGSTSDVPIEIPTPTSTHIVERLTSTVRYDWELQPGDVRICQRSDGSNWYLGRGGFGEVFKGIKDGVDEIAIKVIKVSSPIVVEQFKQEINTISTLRHRHILQFYGACIHPTCLYMVTELMQTDLYSALRKDSRYFWSGKFGREVAVGIASGLHYLHSRKPAMVHRDIKSPNILLMDGLAKIADVGLARSKANSDMTAQRGFTVAWAAPEVVYRRRATEKIDIWSFGVILWEIVSGSIPHVGQLVMPKSSTITIQHLFHQCTAEDPTLRPTAAEIIVKLKEH